MKVQGTSVVPGVDGLPVVIVQRVDPNAPTLATRQLSHNCPRYITVSLARSGGAEEGTDHPFFDRAIFCLGLV